MKRRVAITGIGIVSPLGNDLATTWNGLVEGRSGIGPVTQFDKSEVRSQIAGEVRGLDPLKYMDKAESRRLDRYAHLAVAAGDEAMADSGLKIDGSNADRIGVLLGVAIGGLGSLEVQHSVLREKGAKRMSPYTVPLMLANTAPGALGMRYGAKGLNYTVTSACASAAHAIGDSATLIEHGVCDAMITGGAEGVIVALCLGAFCAMHALSTRNDAPEAASRPFAEGRDGFVIAEGAAVLILEEWELAKSRGAQIYAEIVGYGRSCDAYHMTAPSPDGAGAASAMRMALKGAGIDATAIDHINAHGTSTPAGDVAECQAIRSVFGGHADKTLVTSTKSMTGHMLGAAGGAEAAFAALALKDGIVPPTINYDQPDPECNVNVVGNAARRASMQYALSNSFGFGGTNASLILKRA